MVPAPAAVALDHELAIVRLLTQAVELPGLLLRGDGRLHSRREGGLCAPLGDLLLGRGGLGGLGPFLDSGIARRPLGLCLALLARLIAPGKFFAQVPHQRRLFSALSYPKFAHLALQPSHIGGLFRMAPLAWPLAQPPHQRRLRSSGRPKLARLPQLSSHIWCRLAFR